MTNNVLVIGEDRELTALIKCRLAEIDCRVSLAHDGKTGLSVAEAHKYDLIILDLMLPGESSLEICRRLRSHGYYPPMLMLSSRASEMERILGLEMGADDYVAKPFNILELLARVKAIFRRVEAIKMELMKAATVINTRGLTINSDKRSVTSNSQPVELTAKEFELLLHLAKNPGRVYTREQLLDCVWGYNHAGYQHTVNSHINRLRAKIEKDPTNPVYVRTVWGVGYKFSEELEMGTRLNPAA
jgi:DNA-binding response OmpR family regulator